MLRKTKGYIVNYKNIKDTDVELVGKEALKNNIFQKAKLNSPPSFVLTSIAFDDFISTSGAVDGIYEALTKVQPFVRNSAKEASETIANYLLSANFPQILLMPLKQAYENLGEGNNSLVNLTISNVIDYEFIPKNAQNITYENISNFEDLLAKIKLAWLTLFSTDAIELRTNGYYNGPLTTSLLITKAIRAESSGKIFIDPDSDEIGIRAVYGLWTDDRKMANYQDEYIINLNNFEISQRRILSQETMLINTGSNDASKAFTEVSISPNWQKRQKLDDALIIKLSEIIFDLHKAFKVPVIIDYGIDAGKVFFTKVVTNNLAQPKQIIKEEPKLHTQIIPKDAPKETQPNIAELTKEIQQMASGEEKIDFGSPSPKVEKKLLAREVNKILRAPKWIAEFKSKGDVMLDISSLNPGLLNVANNFQGGFLDGTQLILSLGILPEEAAKNADSKKVIDSLAIDIATAAKSVGENSLLYRFSDIGDFERKLLDIKSSEYSYSGDERFIQFPESLIIEINAIKKARETYGCNNISILFPGLRSAKNFEALKKILNSQGIKKSTNLNIFAEIYIPSIIFDLENLDDSLIDGYVIDYKNLSKLITYRDSLVDEDIELMTYVLETLKKSLKNQNVIFKVDEFTLNTIPLAYKNGFKNLILAASPTNEVLNKISEMSK